MNNEVMTVTVKGIGDFSNVVNEVKGIQGAFNSLKLNPNLVSDFSKEFGNLQKLLDNYRKAMDKPVSSKKDLKNLEALEKAINSSFSTLNKLYGELNGKTILTKVDSSKLDELKEKTNGLRNALQEAFSNVQIGKTSGISAVQEDMEKAVARSKTLKESFQEAFSSLGSGDISQFTKQIDNAFENLSTKLSKGKLTTTADSLISTLQKLGLISVDIKTENAQQRIEALKEGFNNLKTAVANGASGEEIKGLIDKINTATEAERNFLAEASKRGTNNYREQAEGARELANGVKEATAAEREFKQQSLSAAQQVEQLQQSTQYFFGLRNMINLLKRGIREAVDTIKELDAAMTETAVVTNFSVGDMWEKLPEYTANANALGATVQDMYEATTLYYQQGLNAQQAMSIASETMKMARIGGLEAAEATDMMTAALRGFNMELNETSAQRINDVYSNLAAKTASNTEELGTAMQRTASIAASAGMSFEGTAAFLAQAIETTREPAENLGTAMKTIVARFQELKKNPLEMQEVDGETVDYNKVDAALKTIGVDLKDTNGQFRDLDKVFLDISQRWDTLTQTQQRYIATTAAGSRQQSRFIAMMSNYERTMELMGYAKDSEGASDAQFGKTLDSLEAKLNKFQNAWKQFLMNIMNDSWTKGIVTGATKVLDVVNKLINTLSFGGQARGIKSFLSLFTAFTALKYAGRGINMLIGGLGGMLDPKSTAREGFRGGAIGGQAAKITNPIVQAINSLIPHIDKAAMPLQYKGYGDFKGARKELMGQFNPLTAKRNGLDAQNKYSFSGLLTTFGKYGVDAKQQNAILASVPGLKHNMAKSLGKILQESGASPEATKGLIAGFKNGSYSTAQVLEKAGLVKSFSNQMAAIGEEGGPEAAKQFMESERKAVIKEQGKNIMARAKALGVSDLKTYYNDEVDKRLQARVYGTDKGRATLGQERELTGAEKAANTFGALGGALTSAGMSLQMFGSALSTTNPMLGQLATTMGTVLTTVGSIPNMISSLIAGGPAVWAITAAVGALAATLGALKIRNDRIKKSAEKVKDTFEETNKQTQNNISTLKQYREQMATFAKGVDSNGNNVNLSDEDYAQYLEMVDKIAELNPKIVQGYNAQGHAIIDNNKALEETIKLQEEQQKKAIDTYTSKDSLQKLINARNIDKNYKKGTQTTVDADFLTQHRTSRIENLAGIPNLQTKRAPMQTAVAKVVAEMQNQDNLKVDEILKGYNITLEQLTTGEAAAINTFVKNQDQISAQVGAQVGSNMKESLTNAFTNLSEETAAFDEAVAPVVQNLQTYVSNLPAFKNIGPEFQSALMTGLKDIAIQPDLDASQMQNQAQLLIQEFDNLTHKGSDYATAMESVEKAQNQFASSLDASEYAKNTEDALETLNSLLKQYEGNTTAYGQAISEYLQNQIDKIQKFTEEGSVSIAEGFNEVSSTIAGAEGAYSAFQESTKTDFSTGAENMKSIFDEVTKETDGVMLHMEKMGDQTMWKGARALLGDEFVEKNGENVEAVKKELLSLKSELQEGEKGFAAFWDNFRKVDDSKIEGFTWNEDGSYNLDKNINPDAYKEIAEQMHRSEEYVVSMLNKGRQFADIDFNNIDDIRKALSTDNAAITGTTSTDGNTDLFVKKDYLQNAMAEAGIVNPAEQAKEIGKLLAKGVKVIPNAKDMTKEDFKSMGISDIPSLVQKLGDTGQFSRSEIEEYAQQLEGGKYNAEELDAVYKDYLDSQEHPELPSINSIDSHVASIEHMIASQTGVVSQEDKDAYEQANKDVYGELGKADSIPELFSKGLNKNGEKLTQQEYDITVDLLTEMSSAYKKQADFFDKQAIKAEENGNFEDAEWFRKHAEGYRTKADVVDDYKGKGAEAFEPATTWDKAHEATNKQYAQKQDEKTSFEFLKGNTLEQAAKVIDKNTEILQKQQFDKSLEGVQQGRTKAINDSLATASPTGTDDRAKAINEQAKLNSQFIKKMLQQNLDAVLADGLEGLNPREIAADPKRNSALLHMYQDIMEHTIPKPEDLEALGFGDNPLQYFGTDWASDVNSKVQLAQQSREEAISKSLEAQNEVVNAGNEILQNPAYAPHGLNALSGQQIMLTTLFTKVGEFIQNWNDGTAELESNIDTNTTGTDKITKSITDLGTRLKTWWDKLNGLNTEAGSNSSTTPSQPSNQASQATSGAAKGATSSITEVVTKFTSIGQEEVEGSIDTIQTKAEQGADLKVKAIQDNSLTIAQNAINQLKSATSSGVTLKTNTSGIDNAAKAPVSKPVNIQDNATPKIKSIDAAAKKSVTKTINISPHYTGTWQHSVYLSATGPGAKAATGVNNKISYHHVPQAGSAAKGTKKGRLGPRGQGGLTLTGELGYEVAWLPSENRSTILGANGPQMVDLPKDAVIYNHEQSKDILKRKKSISAGSMGSGGPYNTTVSSPSKTSGSSKKSSSKSKKKSSKKSKGSSDSVINNWSIEEVVRFDIDRKLETLASKIKKATDEIDKKLGRIGTKASHISAQTQAQVKNLQAVKANNEAIAASYQRDLNKLDTGGYNAKISYETGGSGKKKKNKTTDETINLSNYIYRDANGDYQIDKNAIANAGSKAKQEAIYKAAEGALNPLVSGLQKAKDAADDAQKQMDELGKKISETFYQWENEITEVYDLTQRISHEESLRGRFSSQVALQLSKLNAGFGTTAQSIGLMQKALERDNKVLLEQIENQQKMIGARQRELKEALSAQDELDNLNRLRNKAYASTAAKTETINWATDQYTAARLGRNYLSNVRQDMDGSLRYEIDWARFNRDQKNDPYNKETYEAIKKYLDNLSSATDEFNNAIKDQTDLIKETYDALKEYQDYVGDYEDTLLKGLEEEIQNEVDNSKKLSDSITNALKDLLDEVKRKLDERRKQEDNRKTEDDIAKKQQRLAALRADTSGGNAVEIAQLEKEIAESQQSYQRTLEDQLLDKLQQQGDEAAKQRERLIDLTEKQLEVSSSNNTALVDMWLRDPETYKEQIKNAWLEAQGYSEKGEAGQYILQQEFESGFANLVTAINQSGFANGFESISGDTSTLVSLLEMLTKGRDKLTDSLSKAAGALQDVEKRDTESFELGKRTQKTAAQWKAEGLGAGDLKKWGYTFKELKDSGFTNAELKNAGFGISDFQVNGISSVADLRGAGFKALDLKNANYKLTRELYNSSTWEDLKAAKFSVQDYVNIGVKDAASLRKAGITLSQLKSNATAWNSNSWAAIRKAGYTAADYKSAGLSYANAIASGFTDQQLYSYYTEAKTKIDNANRAAANKTAYNNAITAAHKAGTVTKATLKDAIAKGAAYGVGKNAYQVASDLANGDGDGGVTWKEVMAQLKALGYSGKTVKSWNPNAASGSAFRKAFVSKYGKWSKFAKGGLASFTGPAWLDGTPSKPELVLNARDTKNFIMLKDVLSKAMDSSSGLGGFGSAAYEININVDHINNDYDVDKIAKRVKENIVKDSGYRNVTQVRKFR